MRTDETQPVRSGVTIGRATRYHVLFLCTGNSARSIMAEALLNGRGSDRFRAYSAGSHPTGVVHPLARDILQRNGLPFDGLRSKSWEEFAGADAPTLQFVFTVCDAAAREACPIWPGPVMTAHWGIADPAAVDGSDAERRRAFDTAFRQLDERVTLFMKLRLETLDRRSLQRQLDAIGKSATI